VRHFCGAQEEAATVASYLQNARMLIDPGSHTAPDLREL
jgi:hypothetical protein